MTRVLLLPGLRGDTVELGPLLAHLPGARAVPLPATRTSTLQGIAAELATGQDLDVDVIIGASFGGLVARALVASGRTRARLILVGTLPHTDAPPAARRCGPLGQLIPWLPQPVYHRLYARRAAREWAEDTDGPWPGALPSPAVIGARLRAIAAWGLPALPPGTVVAWGQRDRFGSWTPGEVERLGAIPAPLPGGHRPHLSAPGLVAGLVSER